jgi:hypothetical protein
VNLDLKMVKMGISMTMSMGLLIFRFGKNSWTSDVLARLGLKAAALAWL